MTSTQIPTKAQAASAAERKLVELLVDPSASVLDIAIAAATVEAESDALEAAEQRERSRQRPARKSPPIGTIATIEAKLAAAHFFNLDGDDIEFAAIIFLLWQSINRDTVRASRALFQRLALARERVSRDPWLHTDTIGIVRFKDDLARVPKGRVYALPLVMADGSEGYELKIRTAKKK